jgi:DNA-directed RNA polymerase subunit RPC12/RpoP
LIREIASVLVFTALMPLCPACGKPLKTIPQRQGIYYHCSACNGRALSIPQVRRVAGDHLAVILLRLLKSAGQPGPHSCPFCSHKFFLLRSEDPPLELEGCRPCNTVWFDSEAKYQALPEWTAENNNNLPALALEINALRRLKELKEKEEAEAAAARKKNSLRQSLKDIWKQESS